MKKYWNINRAEKNVRLWKRKEGRATGHQGAKYNKKEQQEDSGRISLPGDSGTMSFFWILWYLPFYRFLHEGCIFKPSKIYETISERGSQVQWLRSVAQYSLFRFLEDSVLFCERNMLMNLVEQETSAGIPMSD